MTESGMPFESWLTGPDGMHFELYPIRYVHKQSDIDNAKRELYYTRDVVGPIRIIWEDKE